MIKIFTNKYGFRIVDIWFAEKIEESVNADVVIVHGIQTIPKGFCINSPFGGKQHSLISDLTVGEDFIWQSLSSKIRNEIRRADKENVDFIHFCSEAISEDLLMEFCDLYGKMYVSKNMIVKSPYNQLLKYKNTNSLIISAARFEEKNIIFHAYVNDKDNCRLLYSCSNFRNDDKLKKIIGFANRGLHWFDIKLFIEKKVKYLDWGGISDFEKPNGIDKFKIEFNGAPVTYFNAVKLSLKGIILCLMKMILKK